jgi:hypothetical protein
MVNAILEGRKTQTRRVVDPRLFVELTHSEDPGSEPVCAVYQSDPHFGALAMKYARCPYGRPGDRLWVRETHAIVPRTAYARSGVQQTLRPDDDHDAAVYAADWPLSRPGRWRPSIHMPRWASRILLEITDVRVERVQEIDPNNACDEGVLPYDPYHPLPAALYYRATFADMWDRINAARGYGWDANPWVWCVAFRRIEP